MEIFDRLLGGLAVGFQPEALALIALGLVIGILVGAAPGMGGTVGMAVILPFALTLSSEHAVFLLVAILIGSQFGNEIPAILVRVPGSAAAMLTVVEGYPLYLRGRGMAALLISLISSVFGQAFGVLLFLLFVIPLSRIAVQLLFPEIFAVVVFGLIAAAGLVGARVAKGFVAIVIGLLLAMVGPDPVSNVPRFAFSVPELQLGLELIPVVVGLLAFREVFASLAGEQPPPPEPIRPQLPRFRDIDLRAIVLPLVVGSALGAMVGIVPGAGGSVATFISYQAVKSLSRRKDEFGKGSEAGLAAVGASNNAAAVGELVPTFGLGIPGAAPMVIILAALTAQGLFVGPSLLMTRPDLLYAVFGGLMASTVLLAVIGYFVIWPSVYISMLSRAATVTLTMVLVVIGVFALRWSLFDVWVCLAMGLLGFGMERFGYPVAPAALAFVLEELLERNLRIGLTMTDGIGGFVTRPVTASLLALALLLVIVPHLVSFIGQRRSARKV